MNFGEKLRIFAEEKFGSVSKMAIALGIAGPQLQRYVSNISKPGLDIIQKLYDIGCDINWLLSEEIEEKTREPSKNYIPIQIFTQVVKERDELKKENNKIRETISSLLFNTKNASIKYKKVKRKRKD